MKKIRRESTIIVNSNKSFKTKTRLMQIGVCLVILLILSLYHFKVYSANKAFAEDVTNFYRMNEQTIFSIDKIYFYSSAGAEKNEDKRPVWNLNISQYTDIAIYINNRADSKEKLTSENSIKSLKISDIKFNGFEKGEQGLYYKNINDFAKYEIIDQNKINDTLEYDIKNDGDLDYSKPEIYADLSNPITLEFLNKDVKQNDILSDTSMDVTYNGELLRKSETLLSTISGSVSFKITLINRYNQKFETNLYFEIPLRDDETGKSIYDGKYVKLQQGTNLYKFFRVK